MKAEFNDENWLNISAETPEEAIQLKRFISGAYKLSLNYPVCLIPSSSTGPKPEHNSISLNVE